MIQFRKMKNINSDKNKFVWCTHFSIQKIHMNYCKDMKPTIINIKKLIWKMKHLKIFLHSKNKPINGLKMLNKSFSIQRRFLKNYFLIKSKVAGIKFHILFLFIRIIKIIKQLKWYWYYAFRLGTDKRVKKINTTWSVNNKKLRWRNVDTNGT